MPKPSEILTGIAGGIAGASAISAATGIGLPAAPFLGVAGGVAAGVGQVLNIFGAGLNPHKLRQLQALHSHHKANTHAPIHPSDEQFLHKLVGDGQARIRKRVGGTLSVGGGVPVGGGVRGRKGKGVVGTKEDVFAGTADHTAGGLRSQDLMMSARGKVISVRKHAAGKRIAAARARKKK